MKRILFLVFAAGCATSYTPLLNAAELNIGTPNYGGSGCPVGSSNITLNANKKILEINFDNFTAHNNRKTCSLTLPISVPDGFQIAFPKVEVNGYVGPQTTAHLSTDYFFTGQRTRPNQWIIKGESNFELGADMPVITENWSRCGESINMRINVALYAKGSNTASLDSVSLPHSGLRYHLNYRACRR